MNIPTNDEIDVCALWQETELTPERRQPENRADRHEFERLLAELRRRLRVRFHVLAAGLELE